MTRLQLTVDPQRILMIKPSSLGDIVHALPALNLLRMRYPSSEIHWLVSSAFSGLLDRHPQLNGLFQFDRRRSEKSLSATKDRAVELRSLSSQLRDAGFDLVLDMQGLFRSGWFASRTRAPIRVGFAAARECAGLFYTHRVPLRPEEQHAVGRNLALLRYLGIATDEISFHFAIDDADRSSVREMLAADQPYAVLLPGANWDTKRWPVEKFAQLVRPLRERFGLATVVAGASDAAELARQIDGSRNLAGRTTLPQLCALIEASALVIANDTGPMHIAAAMNKPLVTMFGPTNPHRTGPYARSSSVVRLEIACSPCYARNCSHRTCLESLDGAHVLARVESQLAGH
jgi:lipopolysaccharide heptosyltransferase I